MAAGIGAGTPEGGAAATTPQTLFPSGPGPPAAPGNGGHFRGARFRAARGRMSRLRGEKGGAAWGRSPGAAGVHATAKND